MADEEDFEPRFGRPKREPGYRNRVLAASNLARGGAAAATRKGPGFTGSRIGRGAGVGRVLAMRGASSALRHRRVVIKSRIVKLTAKAHAAARAHLRYIQRDGVTREGARGELYDARADKADGRAFLERGADDRHQFRFIVSAEDGERYQDLKPFVRRLMAQMEIDLDTRLDWVAADHFNTGHPHSHILLRGADARGHDLVIARDYLAHGMRERAAELVELDLGPRSDREIENALRADVEQERLTGLDRGLLARQDADGTTTADTREPFRHALEMRRLRKLERLGLAEGVGGAAWRLHPDLETRLRDLGRRDDVLAMLDRDLAAKRVGRASGDRLLFDPAVSKDVVGRVLTHGLEDELADRHYLVVDGIDGRSHFIGIGNGADIEALPENAIVRVTPRAAGMREVDRTIARIAAANGWRYDIEAHLRHDPSATQRFAETHVRRLEAMRRAMNSVERLADGSWRIAPDHLDRATAFEHRRQRERPVTVELLSPLPLERLASHDGATWLDRDLAARDPLPLRESGFGAEVREARRQRGQWLIAQGLAEGDGDRLRYRRDFLATLQRRELLRVAGRLSEELGQGFVEPRPGDTVDGVVRRRVDLASGRFALIENAREFSLVPWRPVLERQIGREVSGLVGPGGINWTIGRGRSGPEIG